MKKAKIKYGLRVLTTLTFIVALLFSLPIGGKVTFNKYHASIATGNLLNHNKLSFNLNPAVEGIQGLYEKDGLLHLYFPYFLNTRFITSSHYLPFIGESRSTQTILSQQKYNYQLKELDKNLIIDFSTIKFILLAILLLSLLVLFKFSKLKPHPILIDKFTTLPLLFTLLVLSKVSLKELVALFPLIAIYYLDKYRFNYLKFFTIGVLLTLSLGLIFTYTYNSNFDYSRISNNNIALDALKLINNPTKVPQGINFVEKSNTINGKLDLVKCHQSLHELGMLTYLKFRDPVKTMASTITNCEFGYLHGSEDGISLLTTGVENSKKMYQDGCKAIYTGKNDNTYDECVHGSGHAFYELFAGDYQKAYKACEIWGKDTNICQVAVTMSLGDYLTYNNQNASLPIICLKITNPKAKGSCIISAYRYVLIHLDQYEVDIPLAGEFCQALTGQLQSDCFFSIGDGMAYQMRNHFETEDPGFAARFCNNAEDVNHSCYMTYIRYMSYYHTLFGKPVPPSFYCSILPFKYDNCVVELTEQSKRPAN